jgi:RNA polymerase sporulation-specific sigma factor
MKGLHNKGIELSDLIQECTIGFEEAIHNFNQKDSASFYTFANICMDRQLMSELTYQNRDKHKVLNEAIPLESIEEENETNLLDCIQDNSNNPELDLLFSEELKELYQQISKELTNLEECVFKLKIQGFDYKEIADILDKDEKSIYNTVQRIKAKTKSLINKESM